MAIINCPECGKEISDTVSKCPNCGYSLKSKLPVKRIMIAIVIIITAIAIVGLGYKFLYKGKFEISQAKNTIELGSSVDPITYLEYNPTDIIEVTISDNGGYTSEAIGNYTVTFAVKNKKGFVKEIPFDFKVTDTKAPDISLKNETVYIELGKQYNPESNIIVSDADQYTINIDGEYDLNSEGTYEIIASAQDNSGNESESIKMSIVVEDSNKYIFRNAKFGDSPDTIKERENGEFLEEYYYNDGHLVLSFSDLIEYEEAVIFYAFNLNKELYSITVMFIETHTDYSLYINHFNSLAEKLTNLCGEGKIETSKGSLYGYCGSEAEALQLGQIKYRNTWETDDYTVYEYLGNDNYEITYVLQFESKIISAPETDKIN